MHQNQPLNPNDKQIRALSAEAASAGDLDQVAICESGNPEPPSSSV